MEKITFTANAAEALIAKVDFAKADLLPAITIDFTNGEVLMQAWLNRQALLETLTTGQVCYYSRSKASLWRKGETSGHIQLLKAVHLDCDNDCLLLLVEQIGEACHTLRRNCFFQKANNDGTWQIISNPI